MFSYPTKAWVGSMTLSGVLLLSSLPGLNIPVLASERPAPTVALSQGSLIDLSDSAVRKKLIASGNATITPGATLAAVRQTTTLTPGKKSDLSSVLAAKTVKPTSAGKSEVKKTQIASAEKAIGNPTRSRGETSGKAAVIVKNAQSLLGIPYVFGGTTRKGFDCSGFTRYVFQGSDMTLPRTSYEQFKLGTSVQKQELKAGDLVFFSTYAKGPSHVGIYIGDGNFIHAGGKGITITSLSNTYYQPRYLGARRVL